MNLPAIIAALQQGDLRALARAISIVEAGGATAEALLDQVPLLASKADVVGITGAPGAGKSSLLDCLIEVYKQRDSRVGVVAVDPTSSVHDGAILGDRIRWMRHACSPNVVIRSLASRGSLGGVSAATAAVVRLLAAAGCRPVFVETVGVGQIGSEIAGIAGLVVALTAPGLGDDIQMMKAGVLDVADLVVLNKADLPGASALHSALAAELEHRGGRIISTNAIDGGGVAELVGAIDELRHAAGRTPNGHPVDRSRLEARIVEHSLALLRPRLRARLSTMANLNLPPDDLARILAEAHETSRPLSNP